MVLDDDILWQFVQTSVRVERIVSLLLFSQNSIPFSFISLLQFPHITAVLCIQGYRASPPSNGLRGSTNEFVYRCETSGSMRACHAAGPGSIPGRDKFPAWGFFRVFFLTCETACARPGNKIMCKFSSKLFFDFQVIKYLYFSISHVQNGPKLHFVFQAQTF